MELFLESCSNHVEMFYTLMCLVLTGINQSIRLNRWALSSWFKNKANERHDYAGGCCEGEFVNLYIHLYFTKHGSTKLKKVIIQTHTHIHTTSNGVRSLLRLAPLVHVSHGTHRVMAAYQLCWVQQVIIHVRQESPANAGVGARQSRHLAINCECGFLNNDSNSLTCAATWWKR